MSHNRARIQQRLVDVTDPSPSAIVTDPAAEGRGRYALYTLPNGDGLLAYRPDGEHEDRHQTIPASIWKVMGAVSRGEQPKINPMDIMRGMMSGMGR